MNLNSKLFDRSGSAAAPRARGRRSRHVCDWEGCDKSGIYRAPKGNRSEGEYHNFCLEHVRHYNTAFNFFAGMNADEVEEHVSRSAQTDGRPSWGFGAKPGAARPAHARAMPTGRRKRFSDPLNIFARYAWAQSQAPQKERVKPIHEPDRRALETLGIHGKADTAEIKQAYKRLVKIHHPDANGGDKASEDRLRSIIAAYTHLKAKGFVTS